MMQGRTIARWAFAGAIALALIVAFMPIAQAQEETRETFSAFAVAMGTSNPPVMPPGQTTTSNHHHPMDDTRRAAIAAWPSRSGEWTRGINRELLQKTEETGFVRATGSGAAMSRKDFPERARALCL